MEVGGRRVGGCNGKVLASRWCLVVKEAPNPSKRIQAYSLCGVFFVLFFVFFLECAAEETRYTSCSIIYHIFCSVQFVMA